MKYIFILGYFCFIVSCLYSQDWEKKKHQMILTLKEYGIKDAKILKTMEMVPRHKFVPEPYKIYAYEDTPLPIGYNQTISQPFIVAYMTELLELKPKDKVLEIGTGSGYQAAILSLLAKEVYTIEIIPELCNQAKQKLKQLNYKNITVICGDGYKGLPQKAPFDKIILTAAPEKIPETLLKQLNNNGILIAPVGKENEIQYLYKIHKKENQIIQSKLIPVRFVPMIRK
ncbi:MAG: protein-L-isoaspartate O-methyltransferase [Leptospiraceae bacterium]|nr:MAG: protein-L-isoaspartate O-methyltransferase [Leptospiraceae bacterium]